MKKIIFILFVTFLIFTSGCVKTTWLTVNPDYLSLTEYPGHPEIHAEILHKQMDLWAYGRKTSEVGFSKIIVYNFKEQRKIYSNEGMDFATIHIPIFRRSGALNIDARTIHPDGTEVLLDPKTIYEKKIGDRKFISFTFPDVTPGSILEYHYKFESENIIYTYPFQLHDVVPIRHVEYNFYRTGGLDYILSYRNKPGYIELKNSTVKLAAGKFHLLSIVGDNLPMLKEEYLGATPERNAMEVMAVLSRYRLEPIINDWPDMIPYIDYRKQITSIPETAQILLDAGVDPLDEVQVVQTLLKWVQDNIEFTHIRGLNFSAKSAEKTFKDRNGDNEDLAVLLISMLKEAGIRQVHPVLTRFYTNGNPVPGFPYPYQFDHVIVVAKADYQNRYLDPSVKFSGIDELYWKSQDVLGIILKKNDVEIITTPGMEYSDNTVIGNHLIMNIESDRIDVRSKVEYTGATQGFIYSLEENDEDRKKERIVEYIQGDLSNAVVDSFHISGNSMSVSYHSDSYANQTKNRIILNPNVFRRHDFSAVWSAERFSNFYYSYPDQTIDVYTIPIPDGYTVESLPSSYHYENKNSGLYFYYQAEVTGDSVIITRENQQRNRVVARGLFEEVSEYYSMIMASDNEDIVFRKIIE